MFERFFLILLLLLVASCGPCKNPKYELGDSVFVNGIEGTLINDEQAGGCVYTFRYVDGLGELITIYGIREYEINVRD